MKQRIIAIALVLLPAIAMAQDSLSIRKNTARFAYFSLSKTLEAMPEYAAAQTSLTELKAKYDAEMKRAEDEFNTKYEFFLDGQKDFAPSIRAKRQAELQELIEKNVAFRNEAIRLLEKARQEAIQPLRERILQAAKAIGTKRGYDFIANTDGDTMPFIDPTKGEDINAAISATLKQ